MVGWMMIDCILLILWFIAGFLNLIINERITKFSYGLMWFTLMVMIVEKIVR